MASPAAAQPSAPSRQGQHTAIPVGVLERDLPRLVEMFQGEWDNAEQVAFASDLGHREPPTRRHVTIRRIQAPALGPTVLRLDEYRDNDPAQVGRQRLYVFSVDPDRGAIRMEVLTPPGDAPLAAEPDPATLSRGRLRFNPGCETWWQARADQFVGWMSDGACRVSDPGAPGSLLAIDAEIVLSRDQLLMTEAVRPALPEGQTQAATAGTVHYRRATAFSCWIAVPRLAPRDGWFFARDLALHDHGGEVWVTTDETPPRTFGFRMRNVRWPTGPNADALTLYAHDAVGSPAIGYAWANPDATRVGLNLRTLQGSCSR